MLKKQIEQDIKEAVKKASSNLGGFEVTGELLAPLNVERPKNTEHGDFAVNVSSLARVAKMPPPKIAETIAGELQDKDYEVSVIAGFINIKLPVSTMLDALKNLIDTEELGKNESLSEQRVLLEYVSANPTGPLHIGHGRWAALGDSLVRILRHSGAFVTPEFYINDAGEQMRKISNTLVIRAGQILQEQGKLKLKCLDLNVYEKHEDGLPYPGSYVIDMAKVLLKEEQFLIDVRTWWLNEDEAWSKEDYLPKWADFHANFVEITVRDAFLNLQDELLKSIGVNFENWFSEKRHLYGSIRNGKDAPTRIVERLEELNFVYKKDGATFLKSTVFGDEKDRVLEKSDGTLTYLTPDIAYHDEKFNRPENYDCVLNIWGADHHGYIPRMRAAMNALGHIKDEFKTVIDKKTGEEKIELAKADPRLEILLGQLVNLIIDGEKTRMGKRKKMLTLQDVVDEVGVDATRYWMVSKSADTALDFNVELAMTQSNENPVFYVQYAHARCASILRNVDNIPSDNEIDLATMITDTDEQDAVSALKQLIIRLDSFEQVVADAAKNRSPHQVSRYCEELASDFHSFYNKCRIITDDDSVTHARLQLIKTIKRTLAQALDLLGVSAPEKM